MPASRSCARFAFAALVCALGLACIRQPEPGAPDVLLVTVDTLRADHLGAYGFPADASPNFDALAAQSALFERAIAASSRTAPSHASIMTSRWVREHSIGHRNGSSRLADDEVTLAAHFGAAGYQTAAFISNSMLHERVGLDLGFDEYDDELSESESNRDNIFERLADQTGDRAVEWLAQHGANNYFLWVQFNDPHGPYTPPGDYAARVSLASEPDEAALPALHVDRGWFGIPAYQKLDGLDRLSEYRSRYAAEILYFDNALGELVAAAERASGGRPLLILITSDHGESLGEHDFYLSHGHATTPELAHVPLILRAPGISPQRRQELVHHIDVLPTLLELAGLPLPEASTGVALGPALRGESTVPHRTLFCDVGVEVGAYRDDLYLRARLGSSLGDIRKGTWTGYRWRADGLAVASEADELRSELERYASVQTPTADAEALSAEQAARLRALGYLGPESEGAD